MDPRQKGLFIDHSTHKRITKVQIGVLGEKLCIGNNWSRRMDENYPELAKLAMGETRRSEVGTARFVFSRFFIRLDWQLLEPDP